ncbi:MAG: NAD(P)-dependent alcohol dehydrogenase [Alphaproteobacteria bacterium]|nr:NAD(P)-dependent alcohol dehydrogenase [Alphaproteobacteria bacterium]
MKAAIYEKYGSPDVVEIRDVPRPQIAEDQVLVQVHASSITTADWRFLASAFPGLLWLPGRLMAGLFRPKKPILGTEFAGRVVSVGSGVSAFKLGDDVFGFSGAFGAHAEYIAVDQAGSITHMPDGFDHAEAAALPFGAVCALVFLRDFAGVQKGNKVLIGGASGGVGVFAVQIAKALGAEVTAVASSRNTELLRALGADRVIDYTRENAADLGEIHDVVFDTAGTMRFARAKKMLKPKGLFLPLEISISDSLIGMITNMFGGKRIAVHVNGDSKQDLETVAAMLRRGEIRPVIDGTYPLADIANAYARVETRHKTGSVIIDIAGRARTRVAA